MKVNVVRLGTIEYTEAQRLQERVVEARKRDETEDTLLLLRHPDVITLGRGGSRRFLRGSEEELGIPVVEAGRGGEVTFHGPGQLVAYPILLLREGEQDLHLHLRRLEEVGIGLCRGFGLEAGRVSGRTGVWVEGQKIAAIGVRARAWITFHGMAFNLTPELEGFDKIVPCGIAGASVTSLETALGRKVSLTEVQKRFCTLFGEVFRRTVVETETKRWLKNFS